jgi:hypothetical protein
MNKLLQSKLETLKEFQTQNPTAHVGGSIGLMLRGIDLKRDLSKSDLDITIDEFDLNSSNSTDLDLRSDNNDFDYALRKNITNNYYVKIDVRINPEPSFDIVNFNGVDYNVSKLRDIIFWKTKYANKGVKKHIDDLETIKTGIRPIQQIIIPTNILNDDTDELPF